MEKEEYTGGYWEIGTTFGTFFIPDDVCGMPDGWSFEDGFSLDPDDAEWCAEYADHFDDYVEPGARIESIEHAEGALYRLSAPGYLDCTDWMADADDPIFDDDDTLV